MLATAAILFATAAHAQEVRVSLNAAEYTNYASLGLCRALGYKRFNSALGESQSLTHEQWVDGDTISAWLATLPHSANSGDIYAAFA